MYLEKDRFFLRRRKIDQREGSRSFSLIARLCYPVILNFRQGRALFVPLPPGQARVSVQSRSTVIYDLGNGENMVSMGMVAAKMSASHSDAQFTVQRL